MNYGELIQFEPIEGSVRLQDADQKETARRLVSSYAISEGMAARLMGQVFPRLRCDDPASARALLVVGRRGTGKSHFLSAISSLGEHADFAGTPSLQKVLKPDPGSKENGSVGADAIAGRFKVVRLDIKARPQPLRDILLAQIEAGLSAWGISYHFPPGSKSHVDKVAFGDMLSSFHQSFPEQGLLVVMDELVDYLRSRRKRDLYLDLHFLGEIGELCQSTKFRFMAGLREDLFSSPQFKFAAEVLQGVKAHFELVPITPDDVGCAVAECLVRKTPAQKAQVKAHLAQFVHCYGTMGDRLDDFVALFPVHPDLVEVFAKIPIAGRLAILPTLSKLVSQRLGQPSGTDGPGLIAFDSLWNILRDHPDLRLEPEIEAVTAHGKKLEKKSAGAFTNPAHQTLCARIIPALCIHRLTAEDIYEPVGIRPIDLRDQLCLFLPDLAWQEQSPAKALLTEVTGVLKELHQRGGDQILSHQPETDQYGLCFQKFRRFVKPELILHWVNAVPFVLLMLSGLIMVAFRFLHFDRQWFSLTVLTHKVIAIGWLASLPVVVLLHPKVHWAHIRVMLSWGSADLVWMVQSLRSLYNRKAILAAVGRFNTGQKINACLVMLYFLGFGATGLLMIFQSTILIPWYVHTALFSATLGSVGGHLFLSLINPGTRIALAGIFHGWSPMEYVEHHHALSLPSTHRDHLAPITLKSIVEEVFVSKVELAVLALAIIMAVAGVFLFTQGQMASVKKNFTKSFADCISPNDLSTKHRIGPAAESCTKCHSYTGTIANSQCEHCHEVVKERRTQLAGYHGTLKGACIDCHKEHLPASQSIVPFVKEKFDHNLASFKLDGKHAKVDCDECHKKKRTAGMPGNYFIGLKYDACIACHADKHEGQFVASCEKCHSTAGWTAKDLKFAHEKDSSFKLTGKHESVACAKCHKPKKPDGALGTALFKGLSSDCTSCHEDPHKKQFVSTCTQCHTTAGWTKKALIFNHDRDSKFKLESKHARISCEKCHVPTSPDKKLASALFHDLKSGCADCHKNPHREQFSEACTKCHSPFGFKRKSLSFDHNKDSKYQLVAKHLEVDCIKCHLPVAPSKKLGSAQFRGLKTDCADCHKDPHGEQFKRECSKCHTTPAGFTLKELHFDHNRDSKYALVGKHLTVECIKCHQAKAPSGKLASATFKGLATECASCHKVKHPDFYGPTCLSCHNNDLWPKKRPGAEHIHQFTFDGEQLIGKHLTTDCKSCHNDTLIPVLGRINKPDSQCVVCHKKDDPHKPSMGPDCARCHSNGGWKGENLRFNHDTMTRFTLGRDHMNVACAKCHINNVWKPVKTACKDCHPNKY
jgi:cytochrome b subunit of formate dehydrogenase